MENSDSDTENECFESAEESIDEDEKNDSIRESKASLTEGGNEFREPDSSQCDTGNPVREINENVSSNSTSYRKRPERVKRTLSKPSNKTTSRSNDEFIFKADKIVSDVFLQEVTSNLSKNINRSLSTLQQTSSNVKDLILNSLPASSLNESDKFSYDDKNSALPEFKEIRNFEYTEDVGDNFKRNEGMSNLGNVSNKKSSPLIVGESGDNKNKNASIITTDNLDDNVVNSKEKCHNLESTILIDTVNTENSLKQEEILKNLNGASASPLSINVSELSDENEDSLGLNKGAIGRNSETLEPIFQAEDVQEGSNLAKTNDISLNEKPESCNLLSEENSSNQSRVHETESHENENILKDNFISEANSETSSENNDNLMSSSENINDSGSETIKYISNVLEGKPEINLECNVNELKIALKNLITDEKNHTENVCENSKENVATEEIIFKGKLMENQSYESSKDGWDDFDFSDTEDDSLDNIKSFELKEEEQITSKSTGHVSKQENEKIYSTKSCTGKSLNKSVPSNNNVAQSNMKNANKEIIEIKSAAEDSWDWDAWDEETEESKEMDSVIKKENSKCEKLSKDTSDLSKWSGWDNFGQKSEERGGNWSLGSWGVDMLLNKATAVTQGISNVLEAGLGAPDPETLARMEKMERENLKEHKINENRRETEEQQSFEVSKKNSLTNVNLFPVSGITSLVAGVTSKIVEHSKIQEIGSKVLTGGLDTLETFGKKTMEVLQEGDPGLKNKRAFLLGDQKPVLSQVLKEAREKAERQHKLAEERELARKCHFETLFDDYQGMVHLEALEMLSTQYELKLEQLRMNSENAEEFDETLKEVEELCSLYENDSFLKTSSSLDFKIKLQMAVKPLMNEISTQRIIQIHEEVTSWLKGTSETKPPLHIVNQKLVSTLAQLSAAAVQVFHKSGELLSIKECRETVEEVDSLLRLTDVLCTEISGLNEKFISLFKDGKDNEISNENVATLSENATTVMTNSISYIRQAFNLLIPVLQFGAAVY